MFEPTVFSINGWALASTLAVVFASVLMIASNQKKSIIDKLDRNLVKESSDKVILMQFDRPANIPNGSPFCLKLESFLRLTNISHKVTGTLQFSSQGKMPWMVYKGVIHEDSQTCMDFLKKEFNVDPDKSLTQEQKSTGELLRISLEQSLSWHIVHQRWIMQPDKTAQYFFSQAPSWIGGLFVRFLARPIKVGLRFQGLTRHSADVQLEMAKDMLKHCSTFLRDGEFLFGSQMPTTYDIVLYSFTVQLLHSPFDFPAKAVIRESPDLGVLQDHCKRMHEILFPEITLV